MLRGALHIHSTYSDGELTLAQLRRAFVKAGCRFLCLTDHAEAFDAEKLEAYRRDCDRLSDDRFLFIAGLEYNCVGRMHVLGYGTTALVDSIDPQAVIGAIRESAGIAVIAHPKDAMFPAIEAFDVLPDGIEVWNSKYDGRYAPRPGTWHLLERLRVRRPDLHAFYGQDLHWKRQYRGLMTVLGSADLTRQGVLAALAAGEFNGRKADQVFPATRPLPPTALERFDRVHRRSQRLRDLMRLAKRRVDALGLEVPSTVKAQLRRIF